MTNNDTINSMQDLCDTFYADEPRMLNKRIYKGTNCGASISIKLSTPDNANTYPSPPFPEFYGYWIHNGDRAWDQLTMGTPIEAFTIQTIVEGSDATVDSLPFVLPVEKNEVWQWIGYMEDEAEMLWREANEYDEEETEDLED